MCSLRSFRNIATLGVENEDCGGITKCSYPKETLMTVILVCPRCHARIEVDYDVWVTSEIPGTPAHRRFLCKKKECEGCKYIYHKMGNE